MSDLADSPVPYRVLYQGGSIGLDTGGAGGSLGFHIGAGVPGGTPGDILDFLTFVGGTTESYVSGGVTASRIVPLQHPFIPQMMARSVRTEGTGRPLLTVPGWTDWKVWIDFALVPFEFGGGDQPYMTLSRNIGATAITMPGQAFAVGGVKLNHDVARVLPEIVYNVTHHQVPTQDDSVFVSLAGKINNAAFLGFAAKTVRFDGVQDQLSQTIAFTTTYSISLTLTWRPRSWNAILLPNGIWAEPTNINDGLGIYELGDFSLLLQ
jgi:hypothetical protein